MRGENWADIVREQSADDEEKNEERGFAMKLEMVHVFGGPPCAVHVSRGPCEKERERYQRAQSAGDLIA